MGSGITIEHQPPRTTPCQEGCNHPMCIAAARAQRNNDMTPLVVEVELVIIHAEENGYDGSDARAALTKLVNFARLR